jgi:hypothetical protein
LSRATAVFVHLATLLVGGTGLVFGWMRYFCEPADEFSLSNHPLEPSLEAWHIVSAPLLVFAVGLLWRAHVWGRIRAGLAAGRRTGIALALLVGPMTLSGYLLQTAVDASWRTVWLSVHLATGIGWLLGYGLHQRARRRAAAPG